MQIIILQEAAKAVEFHDDNIKVSSSVLVEVSYYDYEIYYHQLLIFNFR